MQATITQVTDYKVGQYGPSCKIHAGNEAWFVNEDAQPLVGKTVELSNIQEKTSGQGRKYRVAKIEKVIESATAQPVSNGHAGQVRWIDYATMAKLAHEMATQLEPDGVNMAPPVTPDQTYSQRVVDRSPARAALVNTVMIAFTNGKITLAEDKDDDMPF